MKIYTIKHYESETLFKNKPQNSELREIVPLMIAMSAQRGLKKRVSCFAKTVFLMVLKKPT